MSAWSPHQDRSTNLTVSVLYVISLIENEFEDGEQEFQGERFFSEAQSQKNARSTYNHRLSPILNYQEPKFVNNAARGILDRFIYNEDIKFERKRGLTESH